MNAEAIIHEPARLERQVEDVSVTAQAVTVTDQMSLGAANDLLLSIVGLQKAIKAAWDPVIAKAHEAHKSAVTAKRKFTEPLDRAEAVIRGAIAGYLEAEKKKREEAAAAAYRAEQDRIRLEADTMRAAQAAEVQGKPDEASRILNDAAVREAALADTKPAIPAKPEVQGISTRQTWTFKITDPAAIPREYLVPDMVKIGQVVRAMKDNARIPGVQVYAVTGITARAS